MTYQKAKTSDLKKVTHSFETPLVPGRLIKRYKRFLADVILEDGSKVTAHCPNSGSMLGCMEENGPVYLSPSDNPKRRTPYTWELSYMNQTWVGINTQLPNKLMFRAAQLQAHPLFLGALEVKPEVKISDHSRLDLLVQKPEGPLYVEVKNVTLVQEGQARFPDARTQRGAKHLKELMRLKSEGAEVAMAYVIQREDAGSFAPAHDIDPLYAELYYEARRNGVEVLALQAQVSPQGINLWRELKARSEPL